MSKTRVQEFKDFLNHANTGQVHIYYQGNLAVQRGTIIDIAGFNSDETDGPTLFVPNGDIDELGRLAMDAFENNSVHLFQRKLRDNEYQYIAMKKGRGRTW